MVNFFKAETVNSDILIDETMSIVTADENFEAISGNDALFIYTRYIHPDDVSRFTEALKDYAYCCKNVISDRRISLDAYKNYRWRCI